MNRPIIVLLLLIPTLAFSKLVTVEFTPDEETEIREAIKDRSLRKDTIPLFRRRVSLLVDHPDRVNIALDGSMSARFDQGLHRMRQGIFHPSIGTDVTSRHFDKYGFISGIIRFGEPLTYADGFRESPLSAISVILLTIAIFSYLVSPRHSWTLLTIGISWFFGLLVNAREWPLYLIGSTFVVPIAYGLRPLIGWGARHVTNAYHTHRWLESKVSCCTIASILLALLILAIKLAFDTGNMGGVICCIIVIGFFVGLVWTKGPFNRA